MIEASNTAIIFKNQNMRKVKRVPQCPEPRSVGTNFGSNRSSY